MGLVALTCRFRYTLKSHLKWLGGQREFDYQTAPSGGASRIRRRIATRWPPAYSSFPTPPPPPAFPAPSKPTSGHHLTNHTGKTDSFLSQSFPEFNHHQHSETKNSGNLFSGLNSITSPSWFRPNRSDLKVAGSQQQPPQPTSFQYPANQFGFMHPLSSEESGNFEYSRKPVAASPLLPSMPHMSQTGHHQPGSGNGGHSSNLKPVKMKRTRQRVDAGEPRNSYASIANFSSRGGYHGYNNHKYGSTHSSVNNSGNHGAANLHHSSVSSSNNNNYHHQQQQQQAASNSDVGAQQPHLNPTEMLSSKQLRDQGFNEAAANAAAAATGIRPEMLLDPTFFQLCQNQMAAFLNNAAYTKPNPVKGFDTPAPPSAAADSQGQFPSVNPFYNANAILSQLQCNPADNSLANIMSNVEPLMAAAFLNDAQLLREILEAGCGNDGKVQPTQMQTNPQANHKSSFDQLKSRCAKRFGESPPSPEDGGKLEETFTGPDNGTPGTEARPESRTPSEAKTDEDAGTSGIATATTAAAGCGSGSSGREGNKDDVDEADEVCCDPAITEQRGSGIEGEETDVKEVVKKSDTSGGNGIKEERCRRGGGGGRPPFSLAEGNNSGNTFALGTSSSPSSGGTPLGEAATSSKDGGGCSGIKEAPEEQHDSNSRVSTFDTLDTAHDDDDDDTTTTNSTTTTANHSQDKRARVENIVSNMLLVTNNPAATAAAVTPPTASSPTSNTGKQYGDDDAAEPTTKPVNGCKKRKLYQPQQTSKIQNTNGTVDTEDEDDEVVNVPEIMVGVEAELDEGYDDEERRRLTPKDGQKELDLSNSAATPPTAAATTTTTGTSRVSHVPRSEHLPTKRARLSDYDNGCKLLQSKLFQKYTMQLYNAEQQQQQQQQQQSKSMNGSSHYPRASPLNMSAECDMNEEEINNSDHKADNKHRSNAVKIYDVDLFVESMTSQILSILGPLIENSFRRNLDIQTRMHLENSNKTNKANDILTQMLEANFSRKSGSSGGPTVATVASPNTNTSAKNNTGHGASPFALPNEASPAPKPFSFTQSLPSNFYGKSPFYNMNHQNLAAAYSNLTGSRDNGVLLNGLRETPPANSSSLYGRDDASPLLPAEQTEAMSLVVAPKKRRNKVTDTRLTPRTVTRLHREENRDIGSMSPPMLANGQLHFAPQSLANVPVSLASLQHATDFFEQSATAFPFVNQNRLNSFLQGGDDNELKLGLINGVNGSGASNNPVVSAVAQATAAHLFKGGSSPDSLNGYHTSLLNSYGRGSGTGSENGGDGSETNDTQSVYDSSMPMTSTLSPMHLRKAKLMFFYVRYPSSSILKAFFPDIKFNKNNTAQLVKWFSNFREFYYIQMEKYARQALSEGVKKAEDLNVTEDCELLRVLNLHYNRSNHIPIPDNFRSVSEITLHEFFRALQQNKDTEQSWKKAIYKVIARLDDNVPEYFKNPNFIEQID